MMEYNAPPGADGGTMEDQVIQLDASFDARAQYTMLVWLRPRDATVTIGEPVAVVVDGSIQRVIAAPCTGRIVSVFADAGAPLLPRAVIGMVRPSLPLPDFIKRSPLGAIAAALILLTIGIVSLGNALPADSRISLTAPTAAATTGTPAPDAPTPSPATDAPADEPAAVVPPTDPAATPSADEPTPASAEPTATLDAALPMQPTPDSDPFGTGVDAAQVRTDAINLSRQLMDEALRAQPFVAPGPVDEVNWSNYIEPTLNILLDLESQINTAIDPVLLTTDDPALRDYLTVLAQQYIQACIDPYRLADKAHSAGTEIPEVNDLFVQCQQYLNELPATD